MIAATIVMYEMILSTPLSFVLAKIFMLVPPVIAPEAPCDLPPVNRARIIRIKDITNNMISYAVILIFISSRK